MVGWVGGTQTVPKYGGALIVGLAAGAVRWWWWWWWWWEEDNLSVTIRLSPCSLLSILLSTQQTGQGKADGHLNHSDH